MYLRKSRDNKNDKTLYCQTLDIETGVFTAGYGEDYKVTWNLSGYDSGSRGYIHLYKNFLQMPESILWSLSSGAANDLHFRNGRGTLGRHIFQHKST